MSTVYNLEPATKGKAVLHTTHGDIEIELWPKEAPKATRNFAQLCMEGYYDDTIFHRIIKDFMVQGGDPTGSGQGGESVYGRPFKNEFHSRLKFTHRAGTNITASMLSPAVEQLLQAAQGLCRGLVACANVAGASDSNGSQFFITLERCDHLDRQNTIFGRVSGETIYTVARIAEAEVDEADRPVDAPKIVSSEVLWPPFDDIVPRSTPAQRAAAAAAAEEQRKAAAIRERKQKGQNRNVLSFGDDAESEDEGVAGAGQVRFRSAHEMIRDDARLESAPQGVHDAHVDELKARLAAEQAERAAKADAVATEAAAAQQAAVHEADVGDDERAAAFAQQMQAKARGHAKRAAEDGNDPADTHEDGHASGDEQGEEQANKRAKMDKLSMSKAGQGAAATRRRQQELPDAELLTKYQRSLARFRAQKLAKGDKEASTLEKLKSFSARLKAEKADAAQVDGAPPAAEPQRKDEREAEGVSAGADAGKGYDGKINNKIDHRTYLPAAWRVDAESDDEHIDLKALAGHKLVWSEADGVADPNKRRDNVEDYKVLDPLLAAGREAFDKKQQRAKKRKNEWAGGANL